MSRLVFDIGGTNMRMALAEESGLSFIEKASTPARPEDALARFRAYLDAHGPVSDIAGGCAGIVRDGTIVDSPNLPAWNGFPLASALTDAFGVPAAVHNDALLAAMGEARLGASMGYATVVYLTIGTGVGGAVVRDGAPLPEALELEPGRVKVDAAGRTLEECVGGNALSREFGMPPKDIPRSVYEERAPFVAAALDALSQAWMPDLFVLNGPLVRDPNAFSVDTLKPLVGASVPIALAALGDESALHGAASL